MNSIKATVLLSWSLAVTCSVSALAQTQEVPAPSGWSDSRQGDQRILTKNGVKIAIGPWQSKRGKSTRDWLQSKAQSVSPGVTYVATQRMQAERAVEDSHSLLRSIKVNGRDQISVLYACPGKGGTVRLMEMLATVSRQTTSDLERGAKFGEEVCGSDPNMASYSGSVSTSRSARTASRSSNTPAAQSLAAANKQIPAGNRPRSARIVLEKKWVGFPAVQVSSATAEMTFANGYSSTCAKWNPLVSTPSPSSAGRLKRCSFVRNATKGKSARSFSPGETINVSFGTISGSSRNLGGSSSTISGGTLRMTKEGRIEIGKFNAFSASASGARSGGGSRKIAVSGRYYLDGYTITIQSDDGRIFHGFIAASSDSGSSGYDNIFINGEHYWDRKK